MGLNLKLLPFGPGHTSSFEVLCVEGPVCADIMELQAAKGRDVPEGFSSYQGYDLAHEGPAWGETLVDAYEEKLQYVKAADLLKFGQNEELMSFYLNRAVWKYLAWLPTECNAPGVTRHHQYRRLQSMIRLLNSAVMPVQGDYRLVRVSEPEFATEVRRAHQDGELVSYIGYPQTAEHIRRLSGVTVAVSREQTTLEDGDTLLICKLAYRVVDPATKGQPQPEDFEYFVCQYSRGDW